MKKISFIIYSLTFIILFVCIASCKSKSNETKNAITKEETHTTTETELTDEQIKAIGLQTGSIEQRNLKSTLKVNGKLMLPPQNQAQVSILTGGIIKSILVTEGSFVQQGQTLAVLVNNEIIQLQQDYLENKSQLKYLQLELKRQKSLQEENINATKTVQQVENEYTIAQAKQKGLKRKITITRYQCR